MHSFSRCSTPTEDFSALIFFSTLKHFGKNLHLCWATAREHGGFHCVFRTFSFFMIIETNSNARYLPSSSWSSERECVDFFLGPSFQSPEERTVFSLGIEMTLVTVFPDFAKRDESCKARQ